jgi:serine/threonine protein kinase
MCQLEEETQIARVIVGIVLAMRDLSSQRVIHCNLNSDNIQLDCDWNARIGDFAHSISPDEPNSPNANQSWPPSHSCYFAPECSDNQYSWESDIFSYGLILSELVAREPAFPKDLPQLPITKRLVVDNTWPIISAFVLPAMQKLIRKCWKSKPRHRPCDVQQITPNRIRWSLRYPVPSASGDLQPKKVAAK